MLPSLLLLLSLIRQKETVHIVQSGNDHLKSTEVVILKQISLSK